MTVMAAKDNFISLLSGARMNYHYPEKSDVTIEDIASALSNNCRFSGHLPRFYSIAQHLVNTSYIVPEVHQFTGLMHDTAEAFTNDLPTPLKWEFPVFKELEARIEAAMSKKFGFEFPYPKEIKEADTIMLILEKFHVKEDESVWPNYEEWTQEKVKPYLQYVDLDSWQPRRAKREFLERYYELQEAKSGSEGFERPVVSTAGARYKQTTPHKQVA
jgi:5'-deoxynucleotidase YfbR-like HD superfamily hydrolase